MLDVIFEIWEPEYLIAMSVCVGIVILILLFFFGPMLDSIRWERKRYRTDINNGMRNEWLVRKQGLQPAKDKYRKLTVFDDVTFCFPIFVIHMVLLGTSYAVRDEVVDYFVAMLLLTPVFIVMYIYGAGKIKEYNRDISLRILVRGTVVGDVVWTPQRYRTPAFVEVQYVYVDPKGQVHNGWQKVPVTVGQFSIKKWNWLYFDGKEVDVLLLLNNYNNSYLPMYENFSTEYLIKYFAYIERIL